MTDVLVRERALATSEELFRHAFTEAPVGMALTDLDGRILRVNSALARLLGRMVADLLTLCVADITHPDDLAADERNLADTRSGTETSHRVRKRYRHLEGHDVEVEVHAAIVASVGDEPAYIISHVLPTSAAVC